MRKTMILAALASLPFAGFAATDTCRVQLADISTKTELAKSRGDSAAVARLNIARDKVQTYCSDDRQARRASRDVGQRVREVKKAELELQEAQLELKEAKAEGGIDKIRKKSSRVEEKKRRLESAKMELQDAQADARRLN